MSGLLSKIKNAWPYFVYGILSLIFFLILFFPDSMISGFVMRKFPEAFPGSSLSAEKIGFVIPPGIELLKPVLSIKGYDDLSLDLVRIKPTLLTIAGLSKKIHADARAFGGNLKADASFEDMKNINGLEIWLNGLNLSKMPKSYFKGYDVKGTLSSEIILKKGTKDLDGRFTINVAEGGLSLPFLSGIDFSPSTINVDGTVKEGVAEIKKGVFTAGVFSGDVSGKVNIAKKIDKSVLNLTVNVSRKTAASDTAPNMMLDAIFKPGSTKKIQVTGTIDSPKYSFN